MSKRLLIALLIGAFLVSAGLGGFAADKTQITVWCMAFDPHVNGYTNVIDAFNAKNPDINVTLEPQPGQAELVSKMRAALASGAGTAQAFNTPGTTIYEWAIAGNILPVSPDVVTFEEVKKNYLPENFLQCNLNNKIWAIGIPDPPGDAGLVVNLDALKEAGLPQIAKFDDMDQLLSYAQKLTKKEGGKIVRSGVSFQESNDPMFLYSYIVALGGKFWDNDKQKFTLQTPEARKALQFFYDLFYKYEVDSTQVPDTMSALGQNLAAMGFMWPEFLPFAEKTYPDLHFDFIMKPSIVKGKPVIFSHTDTWDAVVPKYVTGAQKAATFKFLKFLSSEEGQLLFLDANPGLSPLKSLDFTNDYYKTGKGKYLAPVIAAIKAGAYRYWGPFVDSDTMLYNIMWPNMDALFHKQVTVDQCLAKMEKELNDQDARTRAKFPTAPKTVIYYDGMPADIRP
jgi:ABC-type glycerol-3-phosphate transport system substrate-binding protein